MPLKLSAADAVKLVKSRDRVYIHGLAASPQALVKALSARHEELRDVEIVQLHTEGVAPYAAPEMEASFRVNSVFVGPNVREAVNSGRGDYIPVFLSEVPSLFRKGILPLDVALIQVSPPDKHGFCSLGVTVESARAAVETAKTVIAQVNPRMPRCHGDGVVSEHAITAFVEVDEEICEASPPPFGPVAARIGRFVAELVEDGATLQLGIGEIPNAVLAALGNHKDLGIHTELFSDGVVDLYEKGAITGRFKRVHPGKIVSGMVIGTRRLYDFVDDNPQVALLDIGYVNDTSVIRRNPRVTAINSCIEVDLTGQVCADSIGYMQYSGVGGQMDFIRGASLSEGGKPILALPAATSKGLSRIVGHLQEGAGVVTTRAHVHYIVTEYGVANLYGKNLKQRARHLIEIAAPEHREKLAEMAYNRFGRSVC